MFNVKNIKLKFGDLSEPKLISPSDLGKIQVDVEQVYPDISPLYLVFTHSPEAECDECWMVNDPNHVMLRQSDHEYMSAPKTGKYFVRHKTLTTNRFPEGEAAIIKVRS
ncbi:hypothetical protein MYOV003v1_p0018 [Vibrio phage 207E48.1]|nr:hypothetical protein MYOV003v1_p0018 [Vibrio phage 207E48.1]